MMDRKLPEYLGAPFDSWTIEYRVHATQRMFRRSIEEKDVNQLLFNGTIIEEYQTDFPFPSVLINGLSAVNRPLHAVVGIDTKSCRLYLITIYEPDPQKWSKNYSKRILP